MNRTKLTLAVSIISLLGFMSPTSTAQLTWSPEQVVANYVNAHTVHAADLDGDSHIDLVMTGSTSFGHYVYWVKNNGDGSFQPPIGLPGFLHSKRAIKAADIDNDGNLDLIYATRTHIQTVLANASGGFQSSTVNDVDAVSGAWFSDVDAADLDSDGDLDIVTISAPQGFIAFYENMGGGAFGPRQIVHTMSIPASGSQHGQIDIADVAGSSAPDILFASPVDGTFGLVENITSAGGAPSFGPAVNLESAVTDPSDIRAVDIDNDGDLDIVAAANDAGAPLRIYEQDNGFQPGQPIAAAGAIFSMDLADLDLDGMVDIVTNGADEVNLIHGLGGGAFAIPALLSTSTTNSLKVVAADLSGNGYPDVAAAAYNTGTITVILNEGLPPYPGSGGDLDLLTGINDAASAEPRIKNAAAGDALTVVIRSQSAYVGLPPVLVGDFFSTGSPPAGPAGFPDLHINVNSVFALFDGFSTTGVFGPTVLQPAGIQLHFVIPPALAGSSLMLQALVGAPGPSNIFFTATNGHEIRVGL